MNIKVEWLRRDPFPLRAWRNFALVVFAALPAYYLCGMALQAAQLRIPAQYAYNQMFRFSLWDWYLAALLVLTQACLFFASRRLPRADSRPSAFSRWSVALPFLLGAAVFVLRLRSLHVATLWDDELMEASLSRGHYPVEACLAQEQPPLECILANAGQAVFGITELGIRIHTALAAAAASVVFLIEAALLLDALLPALVLTAAFLATKIMFQYSFEARPIQLGLLHAMLLWLWLQAFLRREIQGVAGALGIFAAALLLLLALGAQAPFLVAAFAAGLLAALFLFRRKDLWLAIAAIVAAVALFYPLQWFVLQNTLQVWRSFSWPSIAELGNRFLHFPTAIFESQVGVFALPILVTAVLAGLGMRRRSREAAQEYLVLLAALAVFYAGYFAYFDTFVLIPFKARYSLLGWPVALFTLAGAYAFWRDSNSRWPAWWRRGEPFLLCALLGALLWQEVRQENQWNGLDHADIRSAFEKADENFRPGDRLIWLCFVQYTGYCPVSDQLPVPLGAEVYLPRHGDELLTPYQSPFTALFRGLTTGEPVRRFVVLLANYDGSLDFSPELGGPAPADYAFYFQTAVFFVGGHGRPLLEEWTDFVARLRKLPSTRQSLSMWELEGQLAAIRGDADQFRHFESLWREHNLQNLPLARWSEIYSNYLSQPKVKPAVNSNS